MEGKGRGWIAPSGHKIRIGVPLPDLSDVLIAGGWSDQASARCEGKRKRECAGRVKQPIIDVFGGGLTEKVVVQHRAMEMEGAAEGDTWIDRGDGGEPGVIDVAAAAEELAVGIGLELLIDGNGVMRDAGPIPLLVQGNAVID